MSEDVKVEGSQLILSAKFTTTHSSLDLNIGYFTSSVFVSRTITAKSIAKINVRADEFELRTPDDISHVTSQLISIINNIKNCGYGIVIGSLMLHNQDINHFEITTYLRGRLTELLASQDNEAKAKSNKPLIPVIL